MTGMDKRVELAELEFNRSPDLPVFDHFGH
jgi:hypothetical protein